MYLQIFIYKTCIYIKQSLTIYNCQHTRIVCKKYYQLNPSQYAESRKPTIFITLSVFSASIGAISYTPPGIRKKTQQNHETQETQTSNNTTETSK